MWRGRQIHVEDCWSIYLVCPLPFGQLYSSPSKSAMGVLLAQQLSSGPWQPPLWPAETCLFGIWTLTGSLVWFASVMFLSWTSNTSNRKILHRGRSGTGSETELNLESILSIHFLYLLNPTQGHGGLEPIQAVWSRVHPEQVASPSQTHMRQTTIQVIQFNSVLFI